MKKVLYKVRWWLISRLLTKGEKQAIGDAISDQYETIVMSPWKNNIKNNNNAAQYAIILRNLKFDSVW